jgi:hypothetical protein
MVSCLLVVSMLQYCIMSPRYAFGEHPIYVPDLGDSSIEPNDADGIAAESLGYHTETDPIQDIGRQATEASIKEELTQPDN